MPPSKASATVRALPEGSIRRGYASCRSINDIGDRTVPESILPAQFFDRIANHAAAMPERRLMLAILLDAALHLQRTGFEAAEAEDWIRSDSEWPCSFQHVCEALGLDPSYLRRRILAAPHLVSSRQLRGWHTHVQPRVDRPRRRRHIARRAPQVAHG